LRPRSARERTYQPSDPAYFDPADLDRELDRVFDLCHGCRLCFNLCPSFPTLFDAIDEHDGEVGDVTAASATRWSTSATSASSAT